MSCCGDNQPIPKDLSQAVLAMANVQYPLATSIRNSLPASSVVVHDDGSIEYPEGTLPPNVSPKAPNGYTMDPDNPRLFRPNWLPCLKRLCGVKKNKDGTINMTMICTNGEVKQHFMRQVQTDVCSQCPLRVEKK